MRSYSLCGAPEQRDRYVTANGLKLRVLEWGREDAPYTLMCLHGTSMPGWELGPREIGA